MAQATLASHTGQSKGPKSEAQMLVFKDAEEEDDVEMDDSEEGSEDEEIKPIPLGGP